MRVFLVTEIILVLTELMSDRRNLLLLSLSPPSLLYSEFTKAFQHAADRIQARASFDYFNGSVIQLQKDDRGKFFDALTALSAV